MVQHGPGAYGPGAYGPGPGPGPWVEAKISKKPPNMPILGIATYLHTEDALYAKRSVPSWFLAVFDSKIDECWNSKKLSIFWYTKFQLVTVKYHEVEARFCKMFWHVESRALMQCLYT